MTKATHNGTCQVCGNQQAVKNGVLVNHGYTVDYGYFNGICRGTYKAPLEHDKTVTEETIERITQYAEELNQITIEQIVQVPVEIRGRYGKVEKIVYMGPDEYAAHYEGPRYSGYTFENAAKRHLQRQYHRAESLLSHAAYLGTLIAKVHGKELIARADLEPLRERHVFENYRAADTKATELKGQGFKTRIARDRYTGKVTLTATKAA